MPSKKVVSCECGKYMKGILWKLSSANHTITFTFKFVFYPAGLPKTQRSVLINLQLVCTEFMESTEQFVVTEQ